MTRRGNGRFYSPNKVRLNEGNVKETKVSPFSICDQTLMYANGVVMSLSLQKNSKCFTQAIRICLIWNPWRGVSIIGHAWTRTLRKWLKNAGVTNKQLKPLRLKLNPGQKPTSHERVCIEIMQDHWTDTITWSLSIVFLSGRIFTNSDTIKAQEEIFSRFGVPEILVSDNGKTFTGKEFKDYGSSLAIEHITTPSYNPMSNGRAKMFVDTFERTLRKKTRAR